MFYLLFFLDTRSYYFHQPPLMTQGNPPTNLIEKRCTNKVCNVNDKWTSWYDLLKTKISVHLINVIIVCSSSRPTTKFDFLIWYFFCLGENDIWQRNIKYSFFSSFHWTQIDIIASNNNYPQVNDKRDNWIVQK